MVDQNQLLHQTEVTVAVTEIVSRDRLPQRTEATVDQAEAHHRTEVMVAQPKDRQLYVENASSSGSETELPSTITSPSKNCSS